MQVVAGRPAGRADEADNLTPLHLLALFDLPAGEVAKNGGDAETVRDVDHPPITALHGRLGDDAVAGGVDFFAGRGHDVEAFMEREAAGERIAAIAETAGDDAPDRGNGRHVEQTQPAIVEALLEHRHVLFDGLGLTAQVVEAAVDVESIGARRQPVDTTEARLAGRRQVGDPRNDGELVDALLVVLEFGFELLDAGLEPLVHGTQLGVFLFDLFELLTIEGRREPEPEGDDTADRQDGEGGEHEERLARREPPFAKFGPRVRDEDQGVLFQAGTTIRLSVNRSRRLSSNQG